MNVMEEMAVWVRKLEKRIEVLEAHERSLMWGFATEDFGLVDAGSTAATEQDWVEVTVGAVQGYLHVFAAK